MSMSTRFYFFHGGDFSQKEKSIRGEVATPRLLYTERMVFLQIAAQLLLALQRFKQGFEIAIAKAARAFALNDFNK